MPNWTRDDGTNAWDDNADAVTKPRTAMKIVVTSDWHGDVSTIGHRRHAEVCAAVAQSVEVAIAQKADAYICLGDITDPSEGSDTYHSIALVLRTALALQEAGIESFWVKGNHDVCLDGLGGSTMTPLQALADAFDNIHVFHEPGVVHLSDGFAILGLPYMPPTPTRVGVAARAAELMAGLTASRVVVAAHLMLPGIHPGSETEEMPRGRDIPFPFKETASAALRMNGHYHARQKFEPVDGGPIYIPGALTRLTFGEENNEPGILVIDLPFAS